MSAPDSSAERAKYGSLLQLSLDQLKALEDDDMYAFDHILASKRALIESLTDAQGSAPGDPSLAGIIAQIQETDQAAQRLLYHKLGGIVREMDELQQSRKAQTAYRTQVRRPDPRHDADTPHYMDRKS